MGSVAVLASGTGSNFRAICETLAGGPHVVLGLLCDQPGAGVLTLAESLDVPSALVPYGASHRARQVAEGRMESILREWQPHIIALAGFMRVLSPSFVNRYARRIINIHPSLLPNHRGLDALRRSYEADDEVVGITVHFVDDGVDTGRIIRQETLARREGETLAELENRIHELEHRTYPLVLQSLLAAHDEIRGEALPT